MLRLMCLIIICHFFLFNLTYCGDDSYQSRLLQMKAKFDSINDYSCIFESFSSGGEKSASVNFRYYFAKPGMVRMEILNGKYSGTILLYEDNIVRIKPGIFLLGLFTFSYPPGHRYVCDYRGNGLHNSDWGYFIHEHIKLLSLTDSRLTGEGTLDGKKVLIYELLSRDPSKSRSVAKEHIWIDKEQNLLIRYRQYDASGSLIQAGYYKNIIINAGIGSSVFTNF